MVFIFDYNFDTFFDRFLLDFSSNFGPLETSKIGVAPAREHDFHVFDPLFSMTFFDPQNDPKMIPKTPPK